MKKFIITLIALLGAAGLCAGGFFFYQSKGNEVYNREEKYEYCTDLTVDFYENGFSFLKPQFTSSDEDVLTIDKNGIITTNTPGTVSVTAKGLSFEYSTEITVLEHTGFIANCEEPYTCDRCGNSVYVDDGHKLSELTCEDDSVCTVCGFVAVKAAGHDYADADCETPKTCKVCGGTKGAPLGHKWVPATCTEAEFCEVCQKKGADALGHDFSQATCTEDSYCLRCEIPGEEKALGHDMTDATCTEPKHCTRCDLTEGKALGHKSSREVCLKPLYCTRCEEKISDELPHDFVPATCKKAKYCKRCKITEGKPLEHTVVEATCTKGSYCSVCKTTLSKPLEHLYVPAGDESEICAYCGTKKSVYKAPSVDISDYANEVLRLVNVERAAAGLNPLSLDPTICAAADVRAVEITSLFDHTRPNGSKCFTALNEAGCSYSSAGENIAYGYSSPASVMDGWMNSSGHKANILSASFGRLGVGIAKNAYGTLYWVQLFTN